MKHTIIAGFLTNNMKHFAKFARPDIVPRITQIKKSIPEEILGKRVKAFGVSTPALTSDGKVAIDDYGRRIHRPSKYTVYPSDGSNKAEGVLGHAHYLELDSPEFKLSRSGMYSTRGYKSPKAGLTDVQGLELSSRAKTLIHPITGEKVVVGEKTPYAFVHGNLDKKQNFDTLPSREEINKLSDYPWQSGRMNKVKIQELLNGGSDSFINTQTGKRFVGEQEFDSLLNRDKSNVQLVKKARLSPYGIDVFGDKSALAEFTHMGNFGYVKQANKQLKRLHEASEAPSRKYRPDNTYGNLAQTATSPEAAKEVFDTRVGIARQNKKWYSQSEAGKDPLTKPLGAESYTYDGKRREPEIPKTGWSDIRKVKDEAISDSGYSGFRTDPYKGYGGMMEEGIPLNEVYPNGVFEKKKRYYSRLSGMATKL